MKYYKIILIFFLIFCINLSKSKDCIDNDSKCTKCKRSDLSACETCKEGYKLSGSVCAKANCFVKGCDLCLTSSSYKCYKCSANYYISNYKCYSGTCTVNFCDECSKTGDAKCIQCSEGYSTAGNFCKKRSCSYCETCNSQSKCLSCTSGKFLTSFGKCTSGSCSIIGCKYCYSGNSSQCQICNDGYFRADDLKCYSGRCSISGCSVCDKDGKCTKCDSFYTLANNVCTTRSCSASKCNKCSNINKYQCTQCSSNDYILSYGKCKKKSKYGSILTLE